MRRIRTLNTLRRRRRIIAALERGQAIATGAGGRGEADLAERKAALRRWVARIGWSLAQMDRIAEAQTAAHAAWARLIREDPDGDTAPPEQDVLERLMAEVDDMIDNDRWPRHLHWSL
jgi:hypothetical protein